jgi:hypothetical protein
MFRLTTGDVAPDKQALGDELAKIMAPAVNAD